MCSKLKSLRALFISSLLLACVSTAQAQVFFKSQHLADKILGRWYSEITRTEGEMTTKFLGVSEYLRNGAVSYEGQIISYAKDDPDTSYYCGHNVTYTWQIKKEHLYQTMIDAKVFPHYVKEKGQELTDPDDIQTVSEFCAEIQMFYRNEYPKNKTEEYRILQITDERMVYEYKDDNGKPVVETETRTERGFAPYKR